MYYPSYSQPAAMGPASSQAGHVTCMLIGLFRRGWLPPRVRASACPPGFRKPAGHLVGYGG
jgi:hypothetical protein